MRSRPALSLQTAAFSILAVILAGCATNSSPSASSTACVRNAATGLLRPEAVMQKRCFDQVDIAHSRNIGAALDQQVSAVQSKAARLIREMDAYAAAAGSGINRRRAADALIAEALEMEDVLVVANRILLARDADARAGYDPTRRTPARLSSGYYNRSARPQQRSTQNLYRVRAVVAQQIEQNKRLYQLLKARANTIATQADSLCKPI